MPPAHGRRAEAGHLDVLLDLGRLESREEHKRGQLWSQLSSGRWQIFNPTRQTPGGGELVSLNTRVCPLVALSVCGF